MLGVFGSQGEILHMQVWFRMLRLIFRLFKWALIFSPEGWMILCLDLYKFEYLGRKTAKLARLHLLVHSLAVCCRVSFWHLFSSERLQAFTYNLKPPKLNACLYDEHYPVTFTRLSSRAIDNTPIIQFWVSVFCQRKPYCTQFCFCQGSLKHSDTFKFLLCGIKDYKNL